MDLLNGYGSDDDSEEEKEQPSKTNHQIIRSLEVSLK
jgi:hypothetical protein